MNELKKRTSLPDSVLAARKAAFPKLSVHSFKQLKSKAHKSVLPRVPKAAAWGWLATPLAARVLFPAVVLSLIALATPFWANVTVPDGSRHHATFGLWHYCVVEDDCLLIHDSLLPGRSVPAWHMFVQGTYTIGTIAVIVVLGFVVHCSHGVLIKMSPTTQRTAICVLGIAGMQQGMALYVFATYLLADEFLHHRGAEMADDHEKELYGSFVVAIIALALSMIALLMLTFDDRIPQCSKAENCQSTDTLSVRNFRPSLKRETPAVERHVRFSEDHMC